MRHSILLLRSYWKMVLCLSLCFLVPLQSFGRHRTKKTEKEKILKDPKSSYRATRLEEIRYFKDLPKGNYTIGYGYDEAGRKIIPLAIYDKTFPNLMDKRQLMKVFLASIGVGDFNLQKLVEKVRKKRLKKKQKILEEHFLRELFDQKNKKKKIIFEEKWWKNPKIKWKARCLKKLKGSPDKIPLNCISIKKHSLKEKISNKIEKIMSDSLFGQDVWEGMKERSYFKKQDDGTYELIVSQDRKIPPTKIVDLRGYNSSYRQAVSWTVQTNVVKIGIGQIPFAIFPQVIAAVLERFFNYIEVCCMFQQGEAMSMIMEAHKKNEKSPFYGVLDDKQLDHSVQYLERASVFFSSVIKNLFMKKEKLAEKFYKKREVKREKILKYLHRKKYNITELGQSYALCVKRDHDNEIDELRVYSLVMRKTFRRKPHTVVDFLNPYREYFKRNLLDTILFASNFVYTAIPIIPSLVRVAFKEIAIRQVHRYQIQEAGLRSYLDYMSDEVKKLLLEEGLSEEEADDHIESAYKIIKLRSLNPLVLSQEGRKRRKIASELWIKDRHSDYIPL